MGIAALQSKARTDDPGAKVWHRFARSRGKSPFEPATAIDRMIGGPGKGFPARVVAGPMAGILTRRANSKESPGGAVNTAIREHIRNPPPKITVGYREEFGRK